MNDKQITMIFDTDLRRPACVLLQAAMQGDGAALNRIFPAETWLVAPTPGMKRLSATEAQWQQCREMALAAIAKE